MANTYTTLDRLKQAKDALLFTRHAAERELTKTEQKTLDIIIGKVEVLQNKIAPRAE